jgi:pyruvate formate lyase activating enzyme
MFGGLQKTSLIDFPDRIATVLFTPGCNLRCPFCHNWRLILEPKGPFLTEKSTLEILESRKQQVDAVVITGGEPTIQADLPKFLTELKERGFHVKLDTNGFFPDMLEKSLPYVDYVALDVKTSLEKYHRLGASDSSNFLSTMNILKEDPVDYEFRTTAVPGFVDIEDIPKIGELVRDAKRFAFQQFIPDDSLDKSLNEVRPYPPEVIDGFASIMKKYVTNVLLRV